MDWSTGVDAAERDLPEIHDSKARLRGTSDQLLLDHRSVQQFVGIVSACREIRQVENAKLFHEIGEYCRRVDDACDHPGLRVLPKLSLLTELAGRKNLNADPVV